MINDVLLLDLALEPAQRTLQGFSILDVDLSQTRLTSLITAAQRAAPDTPSGYQLLAFHPVEDEVCEPHADGDEAQ